jgi:hypothetical protein
MKEKILFISIITTLVMLLFTPTVKAAALVELYGYTDKTQYMPGETVTLKFYIYNSGPDEIVLKNVTIYYPWYSLIWGGNETIKNIDTVLSKGKNWNATKTFTIPNDGRAAGTTIDFTYTYAIGTSVYPHPGDVNIRIVTAPSYESLQDMDKLITLFTVQVVLIIVCTVILAATVFLSAHRPQVMWRTEEKAE